MYSDIKAKETKSKAFGKKGLDLLNEHRVDVLKGTPLAWNENLYDLAYLRSNDISDEK